MKMEVDNEDRLADWVKKPVPAVFQGQKLEGLSDLIASRDLTGCVFLGCPMKPVLAKAAADAGCMVIPPVPGLEFDPFAPGLYSPDKLYNKFDVANPRPSYEACLDYVVYETVFKFMGFDGKGRRLYEEREVEIEETFLRRAHDWSISEALDDLLDEVNREKCVAVMGGHDASRKSPIYKQTAELALKLTQKRRTIVTGGGPGLMEAANLGAYVAGFADPVKSLAEVLDSFDEDSAVYDSPRWLEAGYKAWKGLGDPLDKDIGRSIGIPTWFYGHEPPNVFATHIAKYFENSIREEGLLAVARGGIIFADGNGGTVQEIFQDANQNYYRTYGKKKSPMVLFSPSYWNPTAVNFNNNMAKVREKPAYALLHKLATEKNFDDYLFMSDNTDHVVEFILNHPPVK